jgi:hypothetical protein
VLKHRTVSPSRALLLAGLLAGLLAAACRGADVAPSPPASGTRVVAPPDVPKVTPPAARPDAGAVRGAGAVEDGAAFVERLVSSPVIGVKPVSPRSLSLKVALASGDRAVFKPLRRSSRSARWEVAFDALAPTIDAGGVPRSALRRVPLAQLVALLSPSYPEMAAAFREEALTDDRGAVGGAVIEWIDALAPTRFEGGKGRALLAAWLAPSGPAADAEPMAGAASRMIVADYVLGNWDRFSGGNLFEDAPGRALWLIDNNGSFAAWSDKQRARMDGQLAACARFSRSQVARLRALSADGIRAALRKEEARGILPRVLDDGEIALVLARRDAVLERVDALVAERGASAGLAFP